MKQRLQALYSAEGHERCGFIIDDEIVEVENICPTPEDGFAMRAADIIALAEGASATWHTHPGAVANLSVDDHLTYLNWPRHLHYVVGSDGVRCFRVENGVILEA